MRQNRRNSLNVRQASPLAWINADGRTRKLMPAPEDVRPTSLVNEDDAVNLVIRQGKPRYPPGKTSLSARENLVIRQGKPRYSTPVRHHFQCVSGGETLETLEKKERGFQRLSRVEQPASPVPSPTLKPMRFPLGRLRITIKHPSPGLSANAPRMPSQCDERANRYPAAPSPLDDPVGSCASVAAPLKPWSGFQGQGGQHVASSDQPTTSITAFDPVTS